MNLLQKLFYFNSKTGYNATVNKKTIGEACRNLALSSRERGNQGVIMSQTTKLINHLKKGHTVTASEITGKFGLANPTEAIRQIRMKGYAVYGNKTTLWDGTAATKYRLGQPSRAMVAAAYQLTGADLF